MAEFGISKKNFKDSKDVFLIDTVSNLSNENGKVGFTDDEWKQANALIKQAASQESKLDWNLIKDQEFILQLLPYYNTFIRNGSVPSISERTGGYSQYVRTKMENEVAKRKTDKGKQAQIDKFSPYIDIPEKTLNAIFETMDILTAIKNM
ncbi:MAG: hypothetical protein II160_05115, partial [Selenomonas sp.]|nr:hypothetical protein [Selenomonas sp.]